MKPLMELDELTEYVKSAFIAGRDGVPMNFEKAKMACMAEFTRQLGRNPPDCAVEYVKRFYERLAGVYEMGRKEATT